MREREWCRAYFHSPTLRDMRMMFYCVEEMMPIVLQKKFLHNSIQFLLNPKWQSSSAQLKQNDGDTQKKKKKKGRAGGEDGRRAT